MIGVVKENRILHLYVVHSNFVKGLRMDVLKHGMVHEPVVHFHDATEAQGGNERNIHATDIVVEI
jgi:hypothetical protein